MGSRQSEVPTGNLLETSYGLVENEKMSTKWRNMQCFLFVCSAVSGLVYYCSFSAFRKELSDACIVNVKLVFQESNPDVIDEIASHWGSVAVCDFCSYTPLTCSILALIFLVYYIMSGPGGRGSAGFLAQPWRIVMPTILFSILAFSVVFATTWLTYFGRKDFCKQINDRNVTFFANVSIDKRDTLTHFKLIRLAGCKHTGNTTVIDLEGNEADQEYFNLLSVVEIAGFTDTISWFLGFLLVLIRFLMMPDFKLLRFDFFLESSGKDTQAPMKSGQSSPKWIDAVRGGSAHSSDSALSTAQTALTSLDQHSLKQRDLNRLGLGTSGGEEPSEPFPNPSPSHSRDLKRESQEPIQNLVLVQDPSCNRCPAMSPTTAFSSFSYKKFPIHCYSPHNMTDHNNQLLEGFLVKRKVRLCW